MNDRQFTRDKTSFRTVLVIAGIFFCFVLGFSLHRHYSFFTSYDQGIFNQVFWNNLHGRWFESSLSSALSTNVVHDNSFPEVGYRRLGQHFTPALLLWLPIYALFPSPATLLAIQVTLIAAAGVLLYVLARVYLSPRLALMITASYYCGNGVVGPAFSNFNDLCQIPLFIFGLLLALEKRVWWLFWLLAVGTLAIREDSGVVLFGVGVYMVGSRRFPGAGLALCTLSFGYVMLATNVLMAMFSEDVSRRFMIEHFGQYARGNEASTLDILWGMISQPHKVIIDLFSPFGKTLNFLAGQWLPLAFVPAFSPASWAIGGFPMLQLMLQDGSFALRLNWRYAITVVPGMFYGTILWWSAHGDRAGSPPNPPLQRGGLQKPPFLRGVWGDPATRRSHGDKFTPMLRRFWIACWAIALTFTLSSSPHQVFYFLIPDSREPLAYTTLSQRWEHVGHIRSLMQKIPPDASVSATTFLVPHLSGRREVLRLPALQLRNDSAEVVWVDYAIADFQHFLQYLPAFKFFGPQMSATMIAIDNSLAAGLYGIMEVKDGVVLLEKGKLSPRQALIEWESLQRRVRNAIAAP